MTDFVPPSPSATVPGPDGAGRSETLVQRRADLERRRGDIVRVPRALVAFAAAWAAVPILESIAAGAVMPRLFVFHLGLVVPWALLVAFFTERRAAPVSMDVATSGVTATAVLATLAGHRLDASGTLRAFDAIAALPLLHMALFVRPRARVAAGVAAAGVAAIGLAGFVDAEKPMWVAGLLAGVAGATGLAVIAGRAFEADLHAARLTRLRAEIAAHRLIHHADELRLLSEVDTLTGLANRRSIDRRLPEIAEGSVMADEVIGVMMIDVDHFKRFNDLWGHQAGDRCLVEVARAAGDQIRRNGDLIGRFGGEEFVAVLPGTGLEGTLRVAERIRAAVAGRLVATTAGHKRVTVSIGCAAGVVLPGRTIDDLLRAADQQLYAAKAAGRNRVFPARPESEDPADDPARKVA